jgi:hypothetical protein
MLAYPIRPMSGEMITIGMVSIMTSTAGGLMGVTITGETMTSPDEVV